MEASSYLFIGCNGNVAAIDPTSGSEIWRTPLATSLLSATTHEDVCILEHEGRVFAGCHGHLFCLDAGTGHVLWHSDLRGMGYNEVTLAIAGKAVQFVSQHTRSSS